MARSGPLIGPRWARVLRLATGRAQREPQVGDGLAGELNVRGPVIRRAQVELAQHHLRLELEAKARAVAGPGLARLGLGLEQAHLRVEAVFTLVGVVVEDRVAVVGVREHLPEGHHLARLADVGPPGVTADRALRLGRGRAGVGPGAVAALAEPPQRRRRLLRHLDAIDAYPPRAGVEGVERRQLGERGRWRSDPAMVLGVAAGALAADVRLELHTALRERVVGQPALVAQPAPHVLLAQHLELMVHERALVPQVLLLGHHVGDLLGLDLVAVELLDPVVEALHQPA